MSLKDFFKLTPGEREAIDNFAFSQSLLQKGGDAERRFALICLDSSIEVILRAYLLKLGIESERVNSIVKFSELLHECENKGLKIEPELHENIWEIHTQRNEVYHGKTIMVPSKINLETWSKSVESLILKITGINPMEYFKSRDYERVSLAPEDLNYVEELERKFKKTPPYVKKLTWWSEIQRDAIEAGEKWDLYVHYRPRWPFFIPTLVLVKCNPFNEPISNDYALSLESKAMLLKNYKKVWRVWLGIVSSNDFQKNVILRAEDYEGKNLGLILINPKNKIYYCSYRGECKKALYWLKIK
ncbi:MAG: hypothetical protein QXI49_06750 [Candidatus Methanomethylicaceae archaeon]